jgi:hypothetical protein
LIAAPVIGRSMIARARRMVLVAAALVALSAAASAQDAGRERRGPFPSRDEWLLAQPLLTLPATSPDPLPRGRSELRLDGDWGSDFGVEGNVGGRVLDVRFLVDGEHRSGALTFRHGIGHGLTLGVRASVLWRGAGIMDGVIDAWHDALGLPDGGRSLFPNDRLRVEARDPSRRSLRWGGGQGAGLGNLELEAHQVLFGLEDASGWRGAAIARLSAPTATGPFAGAGVAGGLQLALAHPLGSRGDVYLGLGTTVSSRRELDAFQYRQVRPQGFVGLEGRLTRGWSVIVQIDAASRLVTNVDSYPGSVAYLRVGSKFGLKGKWMLEGGITEGVNNLAAATDFGVVAAIARTF